MLNHLKLFGAKNSLCFIKNANNSNKLIRLNCFFIFSKYYKIKKITKNLFNLFQFNFI